VCAILPLVLFRAKWGATVLAVALVATGCTRSEKAETPVTRVTVRDLERLVAVSPAATGWASAAWMVKRGTPGPYTRAELDRGLGLDPSRPSFEIESTLSAAFRDAGFVENRQGGWLDGARIAHSYATVFQTSEGARAALAAERDYTDDWYAAFEPREIREIAADSLGDESWAVQGGSSRAGVVEMRWTRGNALLGVYVNCSPCPSEIAPAARRWADAIDAEARAASG
jgi:hypothetical protein